MTGPGEIGTGGMRREIERQKALILKGTQDVISERELEGRLSESIGTGIPLRVKLGVDPTSSALHLGFTVVLNKLRTFQDLGHQVVLIIGDATAMVGDPTGRNRTRPRLDHDAVLENAEGYLAQAGKVIDTGAAEIRRNSEWLHALDFSGLIGLAARYTVARMLERDDFSNRYRSGTPIYIHEFLYPLLQGWDSVKVHADLELGGTDQLFNLLVGRDLQEQEGQRPQVCLTTPLLLGLDGRLKMSKSYGNTVGVSEPPETMFAKIMRVDDHLMRDWFILLTNEPEADVEALLSGGTNPRDSKMHLAHVLCARYHGAEAADRARAGWEQVVSRKELPDEVPDVVVDAALRRDEGFPLADVVLLAFPDVGSKSGARRLMKGGGVSLDGVRLTDPTATAPLKGGEILRAGKRRVARLRLG